MLNLELGGKSPFIVFEDADEVTARANGTHYGLAAGVFTQDLARGHRMTGRLEAGVCWINAYNQTPLEMPFGGVTRSGIGRDNGPAAMEHYSTLKSVRLGLCGMDAPY